MDNVQKILDLAAEGVNVGEKIANGEGVWQLVQLSDEAMAMNQFNKEEFLKELKSADAEKRKQYLAGFKAKLVLKNKVLESKIESGGDLFDEAVAFGLDCVEMYNRAKGLVEKGQKLFQ